MKNLRFSDKIYSLCVCCMSYKTCLSRDWFGFRILICKNNVVQENFYEYFRTHNCVLYIKQIFSIEERNNFKFVWGFFSPYGCVCALCQAFKSGRPTKPQTAEDSVSCYRRAAVGLSRAYSPSGA